MKTLWKVALLILGLTLATWAAPETSSLRKMPSDNLPMRVSTALSISKTIKIDDRAGRYEALCDLRLHWVDPRLAFDPKEAGTQHQSFLADDASEKIRTMWVPRVKFENLAEPATLDEAVLDQSINIEYNGTVRWFRRLRAHFTEAFRVEMFPVDTQTFRFTLYSPYESRFRLLLVQDEETRAATNRGDENVQGWELGRMWASPAWATRSNGANYAQMNFKLKCYRKVAPYITSIFVPLAAVMFIPILSSIVNVWEGRGFRYEAWQMANLNLSGLVALVALTLTIYNSYPFLNGTDNVVARLLALDYALVALATLIVLTLFRSRVGEKPMLSAHVAGEFYAYLGWALPTTVVLGVITIVATTLL